MSKIKEYKRDAIQLYMFLDVSLAMFSLPLDASIEVLNEDI